MLLPLGGLQLPFDNMTTDSFKRFFASAVGKIYKICTKKLHELGAPLSTDWPVDVNTYSRIILYLFFHFHCVT